MPSLNLSETSAVLTRIVERCLLFLPQALMAVLILIAGLLIARWLSRLLTHTFSHSVRVGETVRGPLVSIVRYVVIVFTLIIALGQLGVEMSSLLAILGAAGLAVGLALQGTLTNIAAGIMLLWLRPFRVGDYVETKDFGGTVREIGLFTCHLETFDGLFIFAPNSALWNVYLRNHTRAGPRTVAWSISLPREVDFDAAQAALVAHWPEHGVGSGLGEPDAYLDSLGKEDQVLVLRGIVEEGSIAEAQRRTPQEIRRLLIARFGPEGEPRAIQRLLPNDSDPSRYLGHAEAPKANPEMVNTRPEAADQGVVATAAQ